MLEDTTINKIQTAENSIQITICFLLHRHSEGGKKKKRMEGKFETKRVKCYILQSYLDPSLNKLLAFLEDSVNIICIFDIKRLLFFKV